MMKLYRSVRHAPPARELARRERLQGGTTRRCYNIYCCFTKTKEETDNQEHFAYWEPESICSTATLRLRSLNPGRFPL